MPRTFGEWVFLSLLGLFSLVGSINFVVATFCFANTLVVGYQDGFDAPVIIMAIVFGLLSVGDVACWLLVKPERILKSAIANLFIVAVRCVYLLLAGFLFWGIWDGGLNKYYWVYLVIAAWLTVVNLPWMLFHLALCVPKFRKYMAEIDSKTRCTCPEECDCQNPPSDSWDGKADVYHVSNECPVHNHNPKPNPDCPIHNHAD